MTKLPAWFKQDIPGASSLELTRLLRASGTNTVCQEAKCPNISDCFSDKKAAFLILGKTCTRNCGFCNIAKTGRPSSDKDEPYRISRVVEKLGLKYVVVTSVTRDDLPDGGAGVFAKTIQSIHGLDKNIKVEVLIPDFRGKISSLECVLKAGPFILAHNIETVEHLYRDLRPMADYRLSLGILNKSKEIMPQIITKSSVMLGLGETEPQVLTAMDDLIKHNCDILTLGQYLAPTPGHYPVKEFIGIGQFDKYRDIGLKMGFKVVSSGPKVRSSYHAQDLAPKSIG